VIQKPERLKKYEMMMVVMMMTTTTGGWLAIRPGKELYRVFQKKTHKM